MIDAVITMLMLHYSIQLYMSLFDFLFNWVDKLPRSNYVVHQILYIQRRWYFTNQYIYYYKFLWIIDHLIQCMKHTDYGEKKRGTSAKCTVCHNVATKNASSYHEVAEI